MPLGARDIMLVVRARNEASGVIRDVGRMLGLMEAGTRSMSQNMMLAGAGLTALGAGFIGLGAAVTSFYVEATLASIDYNRQVALTQTQIDDTTTSFEDISGVAKRVAKDIPAPFDQMQKVLFDIFSSMNVDIKGAERLLTEFSKAAVAGQVDIQAAARASISIMNSFGIPVEEVSRVMDIQFQLVRKGVGTYQEFAEVMGRVTPAAVAAGQSVETMAGMLAFLTRMGLSTAMASTSAARAMELMANPDTISKLESMGIKVKDAKGEFLQMGDIIQQLVTNKGWGKMTGPELKKAFEDTFGTGTIQARRFFDLIIPNFDLYKQLVGDMHNSAGAMDKAYQIMFDQPASRIQEMKNQLEIMKVEIGDRFIPVWIRLAEIIQQLITKWDELSPETQDMIIKFTALAGVVAVVAGAVMVIVGVFLMFAGAAAAAGVSLGTVGIVIAAIVAAFAALVAGVMWVIENWDMLSEKLGPQFTTVKDAVVGAFNAIKGAIESAVLWITDTAIPAIQDFVNMAIEQFFRLKGWWDENVGPLITAIGELFIAIRDKVSETLQPAVDIIISMWEAVAGETMRIWNQIYLGIQIVWDIILNIINFAVESAKAIWDQWGGHLMDTVVVIWNTIVGVVEGGLKILTGIINIITGIISGDWQKVWDGIVNILKGVRQQWESIISGAMAVISTAISIGLDVIKRVWDIVWSGVGDTVRNIWSAIKYEIQNAIDIVKNVINAFASFIPDRLRSIDLGAIGRNIIDSLRRGVEAGINQLKETFTRITNMIPEWKGPPEKDQRLLEENGRLIMEGLSSGLDRGWEDVKKQLQGYTPQISGGFTTSGPVGPFGGQGTGVNISAGAVQLTFYINSDDEDVTDKVQAGVQAALTQLSDDWAGFRMDTP